MKQLSVEQNKPEKLRAMPFVFQKSAMPTFAVESVQRNLQLIKQTLMFLAKNRKQNAFPSRVFLQFMAFCQSNPLS